MSPTKKVIAEEKQKSESSKREKVTMNKIKLGPNEKKSGFLVPTKKEMNSAEVPIRENI